MDSDTVTTTTAQYRLNTAALLSQGVSPSLAALYATNARRTHPYALPLSPLHCPRCAHLPVSTRVLANIKNPILKRRSTSTKTMHISHSPSAHIGNNNPAAVQNGMPSSSSPPRGRRVRIEKSCSKCGHVGAYAFERSDQSRYPTVSELPKMPVMPMPAAETPAPSLSSSSLPGSPRASPALDLETMTRSSSQGENNAQTGAKLEGKADPEASSVTTHPMTPVQSQVGSPSTPRVLLPQSTSAQKRQRKKKAGLQEMLARSKEQKAKGAKTESTGLSAFLNAL